MAKKPETVIQQPPQMPENTTGMPENQLGMPGNGAGVPGNTPEMPGNATGVPNKKTLEEITLTLPIDLTDEYRTRHLDLQLTPRQSLAAGCLFRGLRQLHAEKQDGRHVETMSDGIRWLLEQIAKQLPAAAE